MVVGHYPQCGQAVVRNLGVPDCQLAILYFGLMRATDPSPADRIVAHAPFDVVVRKVRHLHATDQGDESLHGLVGQWLEEGHLRRVGV